jgi:hypothetical protein
VSSSVLQEKAQIYLKHVETVEERTVLQIVIIYAK